jgi:hypothetical protein
MANGNGKSSPFNPDGRSGAADNTSGTQPGFTANRRGPERPQTMGNNRAPQSVPKGGPILRLDPPSDRQGLIGTTADPNQRRPFKIGTPASPAQGGDDGDEQEVGRIPPTPDEDPS